MKSVLMSIHPKWCELIASGKKTIEVRKTKPKIEMPFKVYIYCTKDKSKEIRYEKPDGAISDNGKHYSLFSTGKVIGEFVCDEIHTGKAETRKEAVCLYYDIEEQSCLSKFEFANYWNGKDLYAWHISNLVIYDKPKELSEFHKCDIDIQQIDEMGDDLCKYCKATDYGDHKFCSTPNGPIFCEGAYCGEAYDEYRDQLYDENSLTRPPQSWCYAEGEE